MEKILVPLDGSELSALALPYAGLFSTLLDAEIRLTHVVTEGDREEFVVERDQLATLPADAAPVAAAQALPLYVQAYLDQQAERLRTQGYPVQTEVVYGLPAEAIVAVAERCAATMIVMATHGRGAVGRWLVGSVANSVMRLTTLPVLAIRGLAPERLTLRRIMVPLDGSSPAREALPLALDLARQTGATLLLTTVLTPPSGVFAAGLARPGPDLHGVLREQLCNELSAFAAEARGIPVNTVIGEGAVADTIGREAEYHAADLIVMTSHGHSGLHHFALGSVTEKVLHGTQVPVLVVHNQSLATADGGPGAHVHLSRAGAGRPPPR